ncbi:NAD(P)H-hydrate dehydratase [Xanthovirga aplysinae]|uniref:NAD(P)H-hydrate dehydratase n=1 Tax=Xanthovirga aplysinae TaxID=2529853 RepID=UPI0012BBFB39|nr:NAD(P)H-hydrate dehydratase [Xanthovirga aplysinae]MTI30807.1 NAD(P)H-hydrate dehydratase [Xanthovirga aplysinae]
MKILSAEQIRKADQYTIQHTPISSLDLMERAATVFTEWFCTHFSKDQTLHIVCGTGNNGGDGLAVARLLHGQGYELKVSQVHTNSKLSEDCFRNLERLEPIMTVDKIKDHESLPDLSQTDIIIDALFGSGLSRPLEGLYADVVQYLNDSGKDIVAIDIPSGLFCDQPPRRGPIIMARKTTTFQIPKLSFMFPQSEQFTGEWIVLDIGLKKEFIQNCESPYFLIDTELIAPTFKKRPKHAHKGTFGHALLIAGSKGKMGAAILASRACLRSGVGLLTVHIPNSSSTILPISVPEAMTSLDPNKKYFSQVPDLEKFNVVGIGPGLDQNKKTANALAELISFQHSPMVIDADALNILAANPELLNKLPAESIFTPHPKEFQRLAGSWKNDFERLELQKRFSKKYKLLIVLKGAFTSISTPDGTIYFNSTGNPGMATAGSGDVLTGMVTAFLAQNYSPLESALLAVFLHGMAGDIAAEEKGELSMLSSDIIENIGKAIKLIKDEWKPTP